jgi:hypothetical protein
LFGDAAPIPPRFAQPPPNTAACHGSNHHRFVAVRCLNLLAYSTLAGKLFGMRDKASSIHIASSQDTEMDSVIAREGYTIARQAALPIQPGDTVKAQLNRAWVALGRPPFWRVRAAWYGSAGSFSAAAIRDLQDRYRVMIAKRAKTTQHTDLLHAARLEAAATSLESIDADFHRTEIERYRHMARELRDLGAYGQVAEDALSLDDA